MRKSVAFLCLLLFFFNPAQIFCAVPACAEQGDRYDAAFTALSAKLSAEEQNSTVSVSLPGRSKRSIFKSYNTVSFVLFVLTVSVLAAALVFFIASLVRSSADEKSSEKDSRRRKSADETVSVQKLDGSLLYEIIGFSHFLILLTALFVAVPVYYYYTRQTERTLSEQFLSRVNECLSKLSFNVCACLSDGADDNLRMIFEQSDDAPEVKQVTVVGASFSADGAYSAPRVLVTTDSAVSDDVPAVLFKSEKSAETCASVLRQLNETAAEKTASSRSRLAEEMTVSVPTFDARTYNQAQDSYLFCRPVIDVFSDSGEFVRALIFLEVSTDSLNVAFKKSDRELFLLVFIIIGVVLVLGCVASILVGWHISAPLVRIEAFVRRMTAERMRGEFGGEQQNLVVSRTDEIGRLCSAVNRLRENLADAALADNPTYDGKAVQKAFLPLDNAGFGQESTASHTDENIELFGFYNGASSVSGDYFDYKRLDQRWYVFIKSDVSGHGTPAALIMTIVAVLFNQFFDGWSVEQNGIGITKFVYQVNSFLESLGLTGKFATIIVILFDSKTGCMYLCNAGDNLVHIYDAASASLKTLVLKETPAAGPFSSALVDSKGGFVLEKTVLAQGNILFLYTDGIAESARLVRDGFGNAILEERNGRSEAKKELFGTRRVRNIIEAVFARGTFTLTKEGEADDSETLVFDFSTCQGSADEAITALAAVEKVFRMYKPFTSSESDVVKADSQTNMFLLEHFNLYKTYCSIDTSVSPREIGKGFVYYNFIKEDEQADDLTLFAIKRR